MSKKSQKLLQKLIKEILEERSRKVKRSKRVLYHINKRPARPQPKKDLLKVWDRNAIDPDTGERTGDMVPVADTDNWERYWLKQPVKSGVFLTPNPVDIAMNHGRGGNVYAYKVPEWVINKSGGMHRYDRGSEVLIPEDVWNEAGEEIEFLGKTMSRTELANKTWKEQTDFGRGLTRSKSSSYSSWMTDDEKAKAAERAEQGRLGRSISGLLNTKHPEAAVKMMKADEKREVISYLENKLKAKPRRFEKTPGERKGLVIPPIPPGLDKKEEELLALLKKHLKENTVREFITLILNEDRYQQGQR